MLHIDVDPAEINKNVPADLSLIADAKLALARLYAMVREKKQNALLTLMQRPRQAAAGCEGAGLHPRMVFEALNRYARDVVFTTEVGQHQIWAARHLDIREPHSFLTSGGLGAMGFGLGAAIGAAFATGRQVVNIAGDGSFYMNLAELSTVVRYGLPVVQIVFRNGSLGLVRQMQKRSMEGRYSACLLYTSRCV